MAANKFDLPGEVKLVVNVSTSTFLRFYFSNGWLVVDETFPTQPGTEWWSSSFQSLASLAKSERTSASSVVKHKQFNNCYHNTKL